MKILIEANIFPDEEKKLKEACHELRVEHTIWNPEGRPVYLAADNHVFFYGSLQSAAALQRVGAKFQIWLGKEFDYSYFGAHLNDLVNEDFALLPYGLMLRMYEKYRNEEADSKELAFFRSDSGYKKLQGGIYTAKEILGECKRVNIFKEELLIISPDLVKIEAEFRLVIRSYYDDQTDLWNNNIVTYSSYSEEGLKLSERQIREIQDDLNTSTYRPYPLWVLDIAIVNGKPKQLEANSVNTSGLYNCDYKAIVNELLDIERNEII